MPEYSQGHVKRNPENGSIAVRNNLPDNQDFVNTLWVVTHLIHGPSHAATAMVESWDDLFIPVQEVVNGPEGT